MRKKLLTVTDTFWVGSRGLAVIGWDKTGNLKNTEIGTSVEIVFPSGKTVSSKVKGLENVVTVSGRKGFGILLTGFSKKDNLNDSEVFIKVEP